MAGPSFSRTVPVLVLALALGTVGAVAVAVTAGQAPSEVRLCVKKADGSVRVVKSGGCKAGEKLTILNQQAVPGSWAGGTGGTGRTGRCVRDSPVLRVPRVLQVPHRCCRSHRC